MSKYCRGKLPARHDPRTPRMSAYFTPELAPPPLAVDWTGGTSIVYPMDGNDRLYDCTAAAKAHLVQVWTLDESGNAFVPAVSDVIAFYSGSTGYNPADPSTDQGGDMLTVAKYFQSTGIAGHIIKAYASVDFRDLIKVKQGVNLFGGVDIGIGVTDLAEQQFDAGLPWTLDPTDTQNPEGHDVPILGYTADGYFIAATWGGLIKIDPIFFAARVDEAFVYVSPDWAPTCKTAPCGVAIGDLISDSRDLA